MFPYNYLEQTYLPILNEETGEMRDKPPVENEKKKRNRKILN